MVIDGTETNDRKTITSYLSELTKEHINPKHDTRIYWAREVTFGYGTTEQVRVDFMEFVPVNNSVSGIEKGDFYCYEIKSSVEDFNSKNGHNFIGEYNYYVMPQDVFEKVRDEIPYSIGVFCPQISQYKKEPQLKSVKNARKKDRTIPATEMIFMMFRSAARDREWRKQWSS